MKTAASRGLAPCHGRGGCPCLLDISLRASAVCRLPAPQRVSGRAHVFCGETLLFCTLRNSPCCALWSSLSSFLVLLVILPNNARPLAVHDTDILSRARKRNENDGSSGTTSSTPCGGRSTRQRWCSTTSTVRRAAASTPSAPDATDPSASCATTAACAITTCESYFTPCACSQVRLLCC